MNRTKIPGWILMIVVLVGVAVIAAGIGSLLFLPKSIPEQLSSDPPKAVIMVIKPEELSQWPADAFVQIAAVVYNAEGIVSVELWADGALVESKPSVLPPGKSNVVQWKWMPGSVGYHDLVVRAKTVTGASINSNLVHLEATEPAGFIRFDPDQPDQSDVFLPDLITENQTPSQGQPPAPEGEPEKINRLDNFSLWFNRAVLNTQAAPEAPQLSYSVSGCTVSLLITDQSDSELGFLVYRAGAGSNVFEQVGMLDQNKGESPIVFTHADQSDPGQYYVSAFNGAGESDSNPISVVFDDPACSGWESGGLSFDGEVLGLPVDLKTAYLYFSVNQGPYQRYPNQPDMFLYPNDRQIDLSSLVSQLVQSSQMSVKTLDLEVWGWQDGGLVELGTLHVDLDYTELLVCNLGTDCSGDAASGFKSRYGEIVIGSAEQQRKLYWQSNNPGVTEWMWQITSHPPEPNFNPQAAGLVASGCVEGGAMGDFLVDFSSLSDYSPGLSTCPQGQFIFPQTSQFAHFELIQFNLWDHLYIRMIPMSAGQPAGKPSNLVEIVFQAPGDPIEPVVMDHLPPSFSVELVGFSPIDFADPKYWGCVYITGIDYELLWQSFRDSYPVNVTDDQITDMAQKIYIPLNDAMVNNLIVCPSPYEEESVSVWEEWGTIFIGGLADLWESIVALYESLKEEVVNLAAEVINALGYDCDQACKDALMTGLEIGITYFTGIPPTLPTFEELSEMSIDYAVELAVAEAGVPCLEACKKTLKDGLMDMVEVALSAQDEPGCVGASYSRAMGKNPLCLPDGVSTEVVPEGLVYPAIAQVKITRTAGGGDIKYSYNGMPAYGVRITTQIENPNLVGKTLSYYYSYNVQRQLFEEPENGVNNPLENMMPGVTDSGSFFLKVALDQPVIGQGFVDQTIPVPLINQGESLTIPVPLEPTTLTYVIPQHALQLFEELSDRDLTLDDVGGFSGYGSMGSPYDWTCLYRSGLITVSAELVCLSVPMGLIGSAEPGPDSELVSCGVEAIPIQIWESSNTCSP